MHDVHFWLVMRSDWLDSEEGVETHVYFGPEPTPSVPKQLTDPLEIPSLALIPVRRRRDDKPLVTPITVVLAALCVVAGVMIGGVVGGVGSAEPAAPIAIAPVARPVVAAPVAPPAPPVPAPPVAPPPAIITAPPPGPIIVPAKPSATTDLRIESSPAGATAMFVSDGETTLVGTTPIETTVDPARAYDVLVMLAGHVSRIEHVAAGSNRRVVVALAPAR